MPTYVYKFLATGETIEVEQAFTDDTLTKVKHPKTGRAMAVKKVFQPVGVTFKGSGFFKTDNRGSAAKTSTDSAGASSASGDAASSSSGSTSDSTSTSAAKPEKKASTTTSESKKSRAAAT